MSDSPYPSRRTHLSAPREVGGDGDHFVFVTVMSVLPTRVPRDTNRKPDLLRRALALTGDILDRGVYNMDCLPNMAGNSSTTITVPPSTVSGERIHDHEAAHAVVIEEHRRRGRGRWRRQHC